jgi:uncharacterized membrane protein
MRPACCVYLPPLASIPDICVLVPLCATVHCCAMLNTFQQSMETVGMTVDGAGVAVIVIGIVMATWRALFTPPPTGLDRYSAYRQRLGRAILLGLELLVAGDIIKTVAVAPTLQNMAVLGAIVIIRTFLSFSLELEINGRWPWQAKVPAP